MKARSNRSRDLLELGVGIGIVLLVLFISSYAILRVDLTSEKRFTLKEATLDMAKGLDDVVFVKVFLAGDLPADLKRLSQSTRELLDELRVHNPKNIQYQFEDPSEAPDEKTRNEHYDQLQKQGLQYTSIRIRDKGGFSERIIFPGALITYKGKTLPLQLLKNQLRDPSAQMINGSINNLEYEVASAIRQVTTTFKARVGFTTGHGELDALQTQDLFNALGELYDVKRVELNEQLDCLSEKPEGVRYRINRFNALVIAKPDSAFSEREQYILDQFVMNGGKVLWLIDAMQADLDSLSTHDEVMATPLELGLDRLLFSYGVRLNDDILLDRMCAPIEFFTTPIGTQRKLERFPWYYEPVLIPGLSTSLGGKKEGITHPIVNNIDPIHTVFLSSMDTISVDSVRKTILLATSPYNRVLRNPVRISSSIVHLDPWRNKGPVLPAPVGVLLEGRFQSAFMDKVLMKPEELRAIGYRERSPDTKQIVISDGDVIANRVDRRTNMIYTLGYDRYTREKIYGNRELLINAMNYLLDDKGLISIRSRAITLRQLDQQAIINDRTYWQAMNVGGPIAAAILLVALVALLRKRKYARHS